MDYSDFLSERSYSLATDIMMLNHKKDKKEMMANYSWKYEYEKEFLLIQGKIYSFIEKQLLNL